MVSPTTRSTSWERLSSTLNPTGGLGKKRRSSSQGDTNATFWGTITYQKLRIEVKQKKCPQSICSVGQPPIDKKWKTLFFYQPTKFLKILEKLLTRLEKIPLDRKVTHFHSPFKPVQTKARRVPLHLLAGV